MSRLLGILVIVLSLFLFSCEKEGNECNDVVPPEFSLKIGIEDQNQQSLIGALRTYHPDSLRVSVRGNVLSSNVYNIQGYYYISIDYRGFQQYNNDVYEVYWSDLDRDSFEMEIENRDRECWSEYYVAQMIQNGDTIENPTDTLIFAR